MTKRLLAYLSGNKSLLLQCAIVFAVCLVATGLAKTWTAGIIPVSGGFDFKPRMNVTGSGPALGTQMDLSRYKTRDGSNLKDAIKGRSAMLFVVDPQCPRLPGSFRPAHGDKRRSCSHGRDNLYRDVQ